MKTIATILIAAGFLLAIDPSAPIQPEPIELQAPLLPKLGADDDAQLKRLLPHIRRAMQSDWEQVADDIRNYDPLNPPKAAADGDRKGVVIGGTLLAGAIGVLVQKIIAAIIFSLIATLLLNWLWNHWMWLAGAVVLYAGVTWLIASAAGRRAAYALLPRIK